jgi:hypothetical protein
MKLSLSLRFSRSYTVGRTPWTGDQIVAKPLPVNKHRKTRARAQTHTHTHTNTKHPSTDWDSNPRSRLPKAVHALDRSATVTGLCGNYLSQTIRNIEVVNSWRIGNDNLGGGGYFFPSRVFEVPGVHVVACIFCFGLYIRWSLKCQICIFRCKVRFAISTCDLTWDLTNILWHVRWKPE